MVRSAVALAVMALVGTTAAEAQAGAQFSLGGGLAIPTNGTFKDSFKLGWNGQVGIGFTPASLPVGFEITGNFIRNKAKDVGGTSPDINSQIISGTGNIVYTFTTAENSRFHPYILAGAGAYNSKATGNDVPAGTGSKTKFGIDAGAGFNFGVGRIGAFLEGRFHDVFKAGTNLSGDNVSVNFVTVNVGARFGTAGTKSSGM
jgi:hypothetical protein